MKKILVLTVCVVFIGVVFAGCGGSRSVTLVGTWVLEDGQPFDDIVERYNLSRDGSGIADMQAAISWKVENGRFVFTYKSTSITYELDYIRQGEKLVIFWGGKENTYIKTSGNSDEFRKWRSSIEIDPINDEKRIIFRVISKVGNNRLFIRQYGKNYPEMFIYWGGGEIDNIDDNNNVNVIFRIDDREAESSMWDISNTRESTFYLENILQIIENLVDAQQVAARSDLGGKGIITAVFDVTGFDDIVIKYIDLGLFGVVNEWHPTP